MSLNPIVKKTVNAVPVRSFLRLSPRELMEKLTKSRYVLFEDGVVKYLTANELITNRFLWELLKLTPKLSIISDYTISNFYTNGQYTSKSINKLFEVLYEDMVRHNNNNRDIVPDILENMFKINNVVYNILISENCSYASSLEIKDFAELQFNPEIMESINEVIDKQSMESISGSYKIMENIIFTDTKLSNNPLVKGYISTSINPNQVKQMIAPIGFRTEINSAIFQYPIESSFMLGLRNIYHMTIESRSGAKALFLSNKAIQNAEYSARELQIVTMPVEKLIDGDCGNKDYLPWLVRTNTFGKSDIDNLIGKRYVTSLDDKEEKIITKKDKHLLGTTIYIRTANKCKLSNKKHICTSCFGELSFNIHNHTNIGHISTTTGTQQVSQSILSTKHLTSSATSSDITLDDVSSKFFNVKSKIGYAFKPNLIKTLKGKFNLIISQSNASGIKDLNSTIDIYKLNLPRTTRIESFLLQHIDQDGTENIYPIQVKDGNKYGSFSYEFLKYIIQKDFTIDAFDRYVIDLKDWTSAETVLTLPQVEFSYLALSNAIKSKFKYMKTNSAGKALETPEDMLQSLFDLINSRLNVNIALLEVMVYAFTIANKDENNFDFGRNVPNPELMKISGIVSRRSLGMLYAHERVLPLVISPKTFDGRNNVSHPLDVYVKPNEVLLGKYGTLKF